MGMQMALILVVNLYRLISTCADLTAFFWSLQAINSPSSNVKDTQILRKNGIHALKIMRSGKFNWQ